MANEQTTANRPADHVVRQPGNTARQAVTSTWGTRLARAGYTAKGIVYVIIGALAAQAALGHGGTTTDQQGAVQTIYQQPFGRFLLILVAIGLIGYAVWSLSQGVLDVEHNGTKAKALVQRLGYTLIGVTYAGLAFGSLRLAVGAGSAGSGSNAKTQDWTARLLEAPGGVALVVIAGLVVLGVAGTLYYQGISASFANHLMAHPAEGQVRRGAVLLGRIGYVALGIVFTIIGIFLIVAALQHNPGEAKGLAGALSTLAAQPFGQVLLGIVALGLLAYGIFSFAEARYRWMGAA